MARHYSYATILHLYLSVTSSPKEEDREKRLSSGRGEGRLFDTEPELKVNRNNTVRPQIVVLLRSTKQRKVKNVRSFIISFNCQLDLTCKDWLPEVFRLPPLLKAYLDHRSGRASNTHLSVLLVAIDEQVCQRRESGKAFIEIPGVNNAFLLPHGYLSSRGDAFIAYRGYLGKLFGFSIGGWGH